MKRAIIASLAALLLTGCTPSRHRAEIHVVDDRNNKEYVYTIQRTRKPQKGEYCAVSADDLHITINVDALTITILDKGSEQ